jgi:prenylcysteine oxidase / farnesylcysteine lyase
VIPLGFVAKSLEGSTTVHPYNNTAYEPIELGASIFVEVNKNLWRAANEFDLSLTDPEFGDQAIWDGEQIQFSVGFSVATSLQQSF